MKIAAHTKDKAVPGIISHECTGTDKKSEKNFQLFCCFMLDSFFYYMLFCPCCKKAIYFSVSDHKQKNI